MKVIFFGTPEFAVPTLRGLLEHPEFEVLAVVSQPDKRRGRGKELSPSPVKKVALEYNLPVWQPARIKKDPETLNLLREAGADVFVVVAYGQILSQEILDMPKLGCVNVHGSILPKYRGAAPIQWCIYEGEKETGITTMLMNVGMDTGPMLLKAFTPVGLFDNAGELAEVLAPIGASLLIETLLKLQAGEVEAIPQDDSLATYAPLIKKEDFLIDWSRSAISLHNQVRGFYPNCAARFRGEAIKVLATVPLGVKFWGELPAGFDVLEKSWEDLSSLGGKVGEVVSVVKNFGPVIKTGEGLLLLHSVQLAGKRPQSGWDFVNGSRLPVGEVLENGG
ncbi:methionyl-tRNA formyltransferase [Ancylothrix sp. C2]|uniref:methionyl-tRNA formyltransferase n=1 Tax=Ancylothrix sp. D3o TaxID=2953691 RepID=UPI0021BAD60B|nr:methionyl-tRNA formyltransferase [Ancylothrix sp. D3o]MCT7951446.1 methionyl-tRNA formyltransferase [Ancylothrix sp. D3o]